MDVSSNQNSELPQIVCIVGGPACGKGTQCEKLVRDLKFKHLSIGDLMREEVKRKSKEGQEIEPYQRQGQLVPTNLTINILMKALKNGNSKKYLIDGFPRNLEQALYFEQNFREIDLILNYPVSDEICTERMLKRAAESEIKRVDDTPEGINARLATYHTQTDAVVNFYRNMGKVRDIDASQDIDSVYRDTRAALIPNLMFLYGPPVPFMEEASSNLAQTTTYTIIDPAEFYRNKGLSNSIDEIKIDHFMKYIDQHPKRNLIIKNFPENIRQAKIFNDNFATPRYFFYFDYSQDQFEETLRLFTKQERLGLVERYERYIKNRKELLPYFKNAPYFKHIKADSNTMIKQLQKIVCPEVIFLRDIPEEDFPRNYIEKLVKERDYTFLNVPQLINDEITRGTQLGQALANQESDYSNNAVIGLIKTIFFADIKKRKFILGIPASVTQIANFEENICRIPYALKFKGYGAQDDEDSPLSQFAAKGKLIQIDRDYLDQFDEYLQDRCKWGFVFGPVPENNAKVVKFLDTRYATKVVNWTAADKDMKAKFTDEDGNEPDELSFEQYCIYFKETLPKLKRTDNILFDGWPADKEEFVLSKFIEKVGTPSYIMYVTMTKEILVKKFKEENNVGPEDEFPAEADEEINNKLNAAANQVKIFEEYIASGSNITIYNIDGNLTLPEISKYLGNIIYKKVILFRSVNVETYPIDYSKLLRNYSLQLGITFVNVQDILFDYWHEYDQQNQIIPELTDQMAMRQSLTTDYFPIDFPSVYTPDLIAKIVRQHISSFPSSKYILIFGYPQADQYNDLDNYPRALDEFYHIESKIGPVKEIINVRPDAEDYNIMDTFEEKPETEAPKVIKVDDDGGDDDDAQKKDPPPDMAKKDDPPAEEEDKNKFKPELYTWTNSNGQPKRLSQIFHQIGCEHQNLDISVGVDQLIQALASSIADFDAGYSKRIYLEVLQSSQQSRDKFAQSAFYSL